MFVGISYGPVQKFISVYQDFICICYELSIVVVFSHAFVENFQIFVLRS